MPLTYLFKIEFPHAVRFFAPDTAITRASKNFDIKKLSPHSPPSRLFVRRRAISDAMLIFTMSRVYG